MDRHKETNSNFIMGAVHLRVGCSTPLFWAQAQYKSPESPIWVQYLSGEVGPSTVDHVQARQTAGSSNFLQPQVLLHLQAQACACGHPSGSSKFECNGVTRVCVYITSAYSSMKCSAMRPCSCWQQGLCRC